MEIISTTPARSHGRSFLSSQDCNYDIKDYNISSQFFCEMLSWWSDFRDSFASQRDWQNIIWNNKEIHIDKRPVFYKDYFEAGVICILGLLFDLNINEAFSHWPDKITNIRSLQWAGLRHLIPPFLKNIISCPSSAPPSFSIDDNIFDVKKKKSKDYYSLLVCKIAQYPNVINKLQNDFNFSIDQLRQIFSVPHSVVLEFYVKGFQFKVLNSILYTNSKLYKIGFKTDDLCSFCKAELETLYHLFYQIECSYAKWFWSEFQGYWHQISNQQVHLSLRDVLFGILSKPCPLYALFELKVPLNMKRKARSKRKTILRKNGYESQFNLCSISIFLLTM